LCCTAFIYARLTRSLIKLSLSLSTDGGVRTEWQCYPDGSWPA